jgi:O-antigen/teichoic acid export membrane protein
VFQHAALRNESGSARATMWARVVTAPTNHAVRVFLVRSLGAAALFGLEITLARSLGIAGYGSFGFAAAVATVVSRLAPLGWLNASTRLVSTYIGGERFGLLKGSLIQSHITTALGLGVSVLLLLAVAVAGPTSWFFNVDQIVRSLLPLAFGLTLLELHRYVLRGLHAGDFGEALPVLVLPTLVASAIWIFRIRDPDTAIWIYSGVCFLLFLASSVQIVRRMPAPVWTTAAEFRSWEWSRIAFAMLLGGVSDELVARTAVIVLEALSPERDLGLYQAAARLSLMNIFVLRALTPSAAPRVSVLYHNSRLAELRSTYRRLCLMSFLGCLPFFICFMVVPERVLGFFGPDFVAGATMLRVLSIGYLVSAATGPCATALMMIGKENVYGGLAVAALLLNAIGNYALARYAGGLGAAIATATVIVCINLLYVAIFLRATRTSGSPGQS